jgi:cell wall assembly regulator SMI1
VKIQKMRSNLEEKLMRRMTTVHRRAEEWRATAQAQHLQQLRRAAAAGSTTRRQQQRRQRQPPELLLELARCPGQDQEVSEYHFSREIGMVREELGVRSLMIVL